MKSSPGSYRLNDSRNQYNTYKDTRSLSSMKEHKNSSDMETIILNLHNKMKNLENKYIDLANFYKRELLSRKDDDKARFRNTQ
jgi:hypothetical protein